MEKKKFGLTGSTLKWIAIVTMLIDHIGASILTKSLLYMGDNPEAFGGVTPQFIEQYNSLYYIMRATRNIGRIAFPIFCFLLVEGFLRTKDFRKYILRMAAFAMLSEIPFDLVFSGKLFYWDYQNVMVTLLIGMLTMYGCKLVEDKIQGKFGRLVAWAACVALGAIVAELLKTDYGAKGIIPIMLLYFLRHFKLYQMIGGALSFVWEIPAPLSFLFIGFYNGKRGMKMKYFFYLFYPLHLLVLYLICLAMGLGAIPAV